MVSTVTLMMHQIIIMMYCTTQANVGSVLEQLDTVQELKCKFESDIQEYGRNSTQVLETSIIGEW